MFILLIYFYYCLCAVNLFLYRKKLYLVQTFFSMLKFHNFFNKIPHWKIFNRTSSIYSKSSFIS